MPLVVPDALAEKYREQMRRDDLVFMTPDNQAEIARRLAERCANCIHDWDDSKAPTACKLCQIEKEQWEIALSAGNQ